MGPISNILLEFNLFNNCNFYVPVCQNGKSNLIMLSLVKVRSFVINLPLEFDGIDINCLKFLS